MFKFIRFLTATPVAAFPLLVLSFTVQAAQPDPLFTGHEVIEATITAPFSQIMDARDESEEHEGTFRYTAADGSEQQLDIKVRIRGRFRARKDVCEFAPLRLNFKKKQVRDTLFHGQDKVKLVTHCESSGSKYEQYILREYLSYRFLAALTENAFRTRLLHISYVDSDGRGKTRTKYGFIIEDDDALAERIGAKPAKVQRIEFDQLDRAQTNLVTVFGYFLGNTDFSAIRGPKNEYCCHNVELMEIVPGVITPVPYDFDFAGMVDAPYAAPGPNVGIRKVTTRIYRGLCRNNDLLPDTLELFRREQENFKGIVTEQPGLNKKSRKEVTSYLEKFYAVLQDDGKIKQDFLDQCSNATRPRDPT